MKTPITYYGGKQNLIDEILPMIPKHRIYCEPFFGGGAVFFAKSKSFLEVINDKNDLLINFYQQCIDNFDDLQHKVQHTLHSESEFNKAKRIYNNPTSHTDIEKAWAFWVVTNVSIMATPRGGVEKRQWHRRITYRSVFGKSSKELPGVDSQQTINSSDLMSRCTRCHQGKRYSRYFFLSRSSIHQCRSKAL